MKKKINWPFQTGNTLPVRPCAICLMQVDLDGYYNVLMDQLNSFEVNMPICVLCIDFTGLNPRGQQRPAVGITNILPVIMVITFWNHVSKLLSICLSIYLLTYLHILTPHFSSMKRTLVQTETGEECETRPPNPAAHITSEACGSCWILQQVTHDHPLPPSQLWTWSMDRKCASATSNRPTRSIKPHNTWCIQEPLSWNETHFTDSNLIFISIYWIMAPLCSGPNCGKRLVISCTVLGDSWQAESAGVGVLIWFWGWVLTVNVNQSTTADDMQHVVGQLGS